MYVRLHAYPIFFFMGKHQFSEGSLTPSSAKKSLCRGPYERISSDASCAGCQKLEMITIFLFRRTPSRTIRMRASLTQFLIYRVLALLIPYKSDVQG